MDFNTPKEGHIFCYEAINRCIQKMHTKKLKQSALFLLLLNIVFFAYAKLPQPECSSICEDNKEPKASCARVDGQLIYFRLLGKGNPTIVFSSGTGFSVDDWIKTGIPKEISKENDVFLYDRLYTFNSCKNFNDYMPNTANDVVNRLRKLLKQEQVNPPYILVGHSFGGLYMLHFAKLHPDEVAGLLLLDATSSAGPTRLPKKAIPILKKQGNPQNPTPTDQLYNEIIGQLPSYIQTKEAPPLFRKIPLVVMYATEHCLPESLTDGKKFCMTKQQEEDHLSQQINIFNMSDNHLLIQVNGGHNSFFENAKRLQVIKALNKVIEMGKRLD